MKQLIESLRNITISSRRPAPTRVRRPPLGRARTIALVASIVGGISLCDDYKLELGWVNTVMAHPEEDFQAGRELLREITARAETRQPVLERPHTLVRSQIKYSGRLYRNFTHWHLRPLFASRKLWDPEGLEMKAASFRKTFELFQMYGLDGYATFAWPRPAKDVAGIIYSTASGMGPDPNLGVMLEISASENYANIADDTFDLIVNHPNAFRINGKSVISSYQIDKWSPEKLGGYVEQYRQRSGDKTLFLPQLSFFGFRGADGELLRMRSIHKTYRLKGAIPASILESLMEYLRSYARATDGLYIGEHFSNQDGSMDEGFTDEVLFPLYKAVLAEPEFNGEKILGMSASVGYTSYHGTQTRSRDGTKTVAKCLALADKHRPDMIICPEWDELNEDTGFQPQVTAPMSTQRIMKYYTDRFKGIAPSPNPGDDISIPNLILSQRLQLSIGWTHDIELRNVPDTEESSPYTASVEVLDENDKVLHRSEPQTFDRAAMLERTYRLPSESFAGARALRTRLTIVEGGAERVFEEGLPFTVLRSTTCWNQIYSNLPLRNLLTPERAAVEFGDPEHDVEPGVGRVRVRASLTSPETIATADVVQESLDIYSWDAHNEYLLDDPERRLYRFHWQYLNQPSNRKTYRFKAVVANAPSALTFMTPNPTAKAEAGPAFTQNYRKALGTWKGPDYSGAIDRFPISRAISLAKTDAGNAVLEIAGADPENAADSFEWSAPFKDLGAYGIVSKVFTNGVTLALETYHRPHVNPLPAETSDVAFEREIMVDNPNAVLSLRVVSEEGKIYWSKPYVFPLAGSEAGSETISVYADSAGKFIDLPIDARRVPEIKYEFSPRFGNILHTAAGREFYGHAGSYLSTAIGFVGQDHATYSVPFHFHWQSPIKEVSRPRPDWKEIENGGYALEFDGENGNFLALPSTFMPQRAGFTLAFEIKPADDKKNYMLFNHGGKTYGGLTIYVRDGKLYMHYVRATPHDQSQPYWSRLYFPTDIPIVTGRWQEVTIARDSDNLTVSANGRTQSFPIEGIGLYFQISHFGGGGRRNKDGSMPFFKGQLRALSIKHHASEGPPASSAAEGGH